MADDDDNNEEPKFEFIGNPEDLPPPLRALISHVAARQDQDEMAVDANVHSIYRLFDELDQEQLKTLYGLINICGGEAERATYYLGYINAKMETKFNLCPGCHKNHDEDLKDIVSPDS